MKKFNPATILWVLMLLLLSSCGSDAAGQNNTLSYEETKSMVVDILKSEDGQKAISEAYAGGHGQSGGGAKMKMLSSPEGQQIQIAVKDILTDPSYPQYLEHMMTDPRFAGEFAKAVQKENKQIHKDLLKDPEYQTLMMDMMKNSEMKKMITEVMKGPEYRQQAMTLVQESLENPLFRLELIDLMKKALEEEAKPKKEQKDEP
ncbi:MAG TPA: spore germination lipoprotein GerD [Bacilli bacterium]